MKVPDLRRDDRRRSGRNAGADPIERNASLLF
jgi:hypothetical protein